MLKVKKRREEKQNIEKIYFGGQVNTFKKIIKTL